MLKHFVFVGCIFVTREEMWGEVLKYFVSVGYIFVTRKQRGSLGVRMDVFCVHGLHFCNPQSGSEMVVVLMCYVFTGYIFVTSNNGV